MLQNHLGSFQRRLFSVVDTDAKTGIVQVRLVVKGDPVYFTLTQFSTTTPALRDPKGGDRMNAWIEVALPERISQSLS